MGHTFQESGPSTNPIICLKIFHFSFSKKKPKKQKTNKQKKTPQGSKKITVPSHLEENNTFEVFCPYTNSINYVYTLFTCKQMVQEQPWPQAT